MADMRRRTPEPPPRPPKIEIKPGLAQETLRELAPLLAEEGIDVDNIDVPDLQTLQAAINRAVERHNMTWFTSVGHAGDLAVTTLRLVIEAVAAGGSVDFDRAKFSRGEVDFGNVKDWSHPPTFSRLGASPVGVTLPAGRTLNMR